MLVQVGSRFLKRKVFALLSVSIIISCSSTSTTGGSNDPSSLNTNPESLCQLTSSNPEGTGSLPYCDRVFDESSVTMTTYKYSTTDDPDGPGNVDLYMDVYSSTSSDDNDRPFVVWMHAGGGVRDDPDPSSWCGEKFATRGYVCASIDYRDSNSSGFTTNDQKLALSDAQAAIRYFRAHASTFRINPNKAILMGRSAGALTAVQASVTGNDLDADYFNDSEVNTSNSSEPSWVCASATLSGAISSNIMSMVDSHDPPNFAYHGEDDLTVAYSQAVETVDTMNALDIPSTLVTFEDTAHSLGNADIIESDLFPQFYDWVIASDCPHEYMSQNEI